MPEPGPEHDLTDLVLAAYRRGWFPMTDPDDPAGELAWFDPDPRAVFPLRLEPPLDPASPDPAFHIPKRLARTLATGPFSVTTDHAFGRVIRACADPRRPGGWIDSRIIAMFEALHDAGHAHSIEVWRPAQPDQLDHAESPGDPFTLERDHREPIPASPPPENATLVGGLYGLAVGGLFAGESMFSRPDLGGTDASKVALVRTVCHLRARGFRLFDTQFINPHLEQFNCVELPRDAYQALLADALAHNPRW